MSRNDLILVVALPVAAVLLGVVFGIVLPRLRRNRPRSIPLVIAPFEDAGRMPARPGRVSPLPPRPGMQPMGSFAMAPQSPPAAPQSPAAPTAPPPLATSAPELRPLRSTAPARGNLAVVSSSEAPPKPDDAATADRRPSPDSRPRLEMVTAETSAVTAGRTAAARPPLAMEGTLQFLPGRLEIVDGRDVGQEIRFVKQPGAAATEVTFGRADGEPYRHIQLHEPTVSRMHARMSLEDKRWRLTNLSATNPVVVNSSPLEGAGASIVLTEGDRIEMGEVVFRFRAK